jgi:toxin ParE1/3/4
MRVAYATAARYDLVEIGAWIAEDNPSRAESFVNELQDACDSLAHMPRAFPVLLRRRGV